MQKEVPKPRIEELEKVDSIEDTHVVVFKPNEGPQTEFLAASEREVLYGGAAGGGISFGDPWTMNAPWEKDYRYLS